MAAPAGRYDVLECYWGGPLPPGSVQEEVRKYRAWPACGRQVRVRDWSLITGRGGGYKTGGGRQVKFYPHKKRGVGVGCGNSFSHAEGGAQQVLR